MIKTNYQLNLEVFWSPSNSTRSEMPSSISNLKNYNPNNFPIFKNKKIHLNRTKSKISRQIKKTNKKYFKKRKISYIFQQWKYRNHLFG